MCIFLPKIRKSMPVYCVDMQYDQLHSWTQPKLFNAIIAWMFQVSYINSLNFNTFSMHSNFGNKGQCKLSQVGFATTFNLFQQKCYTCTFIYIC